MEDKMAWRRVHAELVENHRLAQDMSATLTESRACRTKLLSFFTTDGNSGSNMKVGDDTGVKGESTCPVSFNLFCVKIRESRGNFPSSCSWGWSDSLRCGRAHKEAGFL